MLEVTAIIITTCLLTMIVNTLRDARQVTNNGV